MKESRLYKHDEEKANGLNEPVMAYDVLRQADSIQCGMPKDLLVDVAEYALRAHREGRCLPHADVMNDMQKEKGWS